MHARCKKTKQGGKGWVGAYGGPRQTHSGSGGARRSANDLTGTLRMLFSWTLKELGLGIVSSSRRALATCVVSPTIHRLPTPSCVVVVFGSVCDCAPRGSRTHQAASHSLTHAQRNAQHGQPAMICCTRCDRSSSVCRSACRGMCHHPVWCALQSHTHVSVSFPFPCVSIMYMWQQKTRKQARQGTPYKQNENSDRSRPT